MVGGHVAENAVLYLPGQWIKLTTDQKYSIRSVFHRNSLPLPLLVLCNYWCCQDTVSHCSHSAGIRPASSGWKNLHFAMKEKTQALQWKRILKHCNERAQVSIWETILLPGQVKVGFKAVGRSCSNRKGFSTLYFFFLPCIFFLPVFFSSFHPVFLFSHRVFPSYWSLAVAMPRPNLEGEGEYQPKKQKFLSLSLENHFFQKLSLCSFLMDSSSRQQCPWGEETELWPQLKSQNQKHFTPRPIFRALHKVFDNSSVREEVGGRVKINRLDK